MMGEKQFYICEGEDNIRGNFGEVDKPLNNTEIVNLLNEQQATISQLQDLCGQSDGENAKLRIENKRLQEENEQLKHYKLYEDNKRLQTIIADLKEENDEWKKENRKLLDQIQEFERIPKSIRELWVE